MSDREEREALANELENLLGREAYYPSEIELDYFADAVLTAGYRKPRTITTPEELDQLPVGAVVLEGEVAVKREDGNWKLSDLVGTYTSEEIRLPATVIHEAVAR